MSGDLQFYPRELDPGDPQFFAASDRGRVHVLAGHVAWGDSLAAQLLRRPRALCGATAAPLHQTGVGHFADGRLCPRCHAAWARRGLDPALLFDPGRPDAD